MNHLTERERITILMMRGWGENVRSYNNVTDLFNENFRVNETPISKSTVIRTVQRFEETGHVKDRPKQGRPASSTNPEKSLDCLLSFIEDPHSSIRRTSQQHEISKTSIGNILKRYKFHPYKVKLVHELNEDDFDRRLEFCEIMMERIHENPQFSFNIAFSDEATFQLDGTLNRHNCRYWADSNPHWIREHNTQYPEKLNVWAGILNNQIIGPFFIQGNLNAEVYLNMLQNQIVPAITQIVGQNFDVTYYQHDGAPAHYGNNIRDYLNQTFPNRWIGRRGSIEWPPRSPDLTPLDYFFWGYLKDRVYRTKPQDLAELRQRIEDEIALISVNVLQNVTESFYNRLGYCQEVLGHNFEHLIHDH